MIRISSRSMSAFAVIVSMMLVLAGPRMGWTQVDPLPVTRTPVAKEDEAAAKKRAQQEGWQLVPAREFDTQLARARGHLLGVKSIARLIESRYRADFNGSALTEGTATWRIQAPADSAGLLRCPQWNLAVEEPSWKDDAKATVLFGMLDGADMGLWVDAAGERELGFGWSARGASSPQGTQFDLHIPSAPIMLLEVRMPAEYQLVLGKNVAMVTGPHADATSNLMLWRIRATGRSQLDFTIRKISNDTAPATILAAVESRQTLTPDRLQADFDFNLDVLHHPVRDLSFSLTRGLKVFEVSCRQTEIKNWAVRDTDGPSVLTLTLGEPVQGSALALRIRAFLPSSGDSWTCPDIRLQKATQRSEVVKLVIPADNPLQTWEPGDFRLTDTQDDQGTQTLTLVSGLPQGDSKRPRFLVKTPGVELTTTQKTRWIIGPTMSTATSDINYDLSRGQLLQLKLTLRLPKVGTWRVAGVKLGDIPLTWGVVDSTLIVDLKKSITPRTDAVLQVVLAGDWNLGDEMPRFVEFPEVEPLDSPLRQGTVAVQVSPLVQASLVGGSMTGYQLDPGKDEQATFYFGYRNQRASGQLRLVGLPAQYAARVQQTASLRGEECLVNAEVTIEPLVGQPTFVDVWVQGRAAVSLKGDGKDSPVRWLERLQQPEIQQFVALIAGGNALGTSAVQALLPRGQHWRIHFHEPIKEPVTFEMQSLRRVPLSLGPWMMCMQPATHPYTQSASLAQMDAPDNQVWIVPILGMPRAERFASEILLLPEEVSIKNVRGSGIDMPTSNVEPNEVAAAHATPASTAPASRSFRYGSWSLVDYPRLWVTTQPKKASAQESAAIDHARLATFVDGRGKLYNHLTWTLWNWRDRDFVLHLPGAQQVLSVRLDGHVLDHWLLQPAGAKQRLQIPLMFDSPRDRPLHRLEIVYAPKEDTRAEPWVGHVAVPPPEFPIRPMQYRHTWHLAPGLLPLHQEQMQSLMREVPGSLLGRTVWHAGSEFAESFLGEREQTWRMRQIENLQSAEREVRRPAPDRPWLGHWVQALAFHPALEATPVVLDREVLRRLDWTPQRTLSGVDPSKPFWESLKLRYVPCPDGILLTSQERAELADDPVFARGLYRVVREAAQTGQDRSGQFCAADYWLRTEAADADALDHLPPFLQDLVAEGWSDWEWLPGRSADGLAFVHVVALRWLGVVLAIVLVLIGNGMRTWSPRLAMRLGLALLLVWWLGCNLAPASLRELFAWPLLGTIMLLSVFYLTDWQLLPTALSPAEPRPGRSTHKAPRPVLGGLLVLALPLAGWLAPSFGQPDMTTDIRILAAQGKTPEQAIVPPTLEERIKTALEKPPTGFSDAVFLKSRYQGSWHGSFARIHADIDVYCFRDKTKLLLPLVGADLEPGMTVDGAKVYPVVAPGPAFTGYQLSLEGSGVHRIKLSFLLQPQSSGEFTELRCAIPAAADAQLEGVFPLSWQNPHVTACLGEDAIRKSEKGSFWEVHADLGRENTLSLRWRGDAAVGKAQVEVRETYLVELRPAGANLTALLQYKVAKGLIEHLHVALQDLEVRRVDWSLDGKNFTPLPSWSVTPKGEARLLHLNLPEPASGAFQFLLEMTPRLDAPDKVEVRVPLPIGVRNQDSFFAFRSEGLDSTLSTVQLADTRIKSEDFAWPRKIDGPFAAYSFGRKAAQAALRFETHVPVPQATIAALWTLQPPYVDLRGDMAWTSAEPFSLIQFEIPQTVTLTDVQGQKPQDVHHWSRTKNLVQVWLQKPMKQVNLSAIGWMKLPVLKENRFFVPPLGPAQGRALGNSVIVQTSSQYQLLPTQRKDKALKIIDDTPTRRVYELVASKAQVDVGFEKRTSAPSWQALTQVEVHDDVASWRTALLARHPFGQYAGIKLTLRNWPYRVQPRWNEFLSVRNYQRKGDDHHWVLDGKPGAGPSLIAIKFQGRWPRKHAPALNVPALEIQGAGKYPHWMMLEGCELTPASRVLANADDMDLPDDWAQLVPDDAEVLSFVAPHAEVMVRPQSRVRHVPIEVLHAQQTTFYSSADSWYHRMEWLLHTKSSPELPIVLPRGAQWTRLIVNGLPVTPVLSSEDRLTVPMPAESLCQVKFEWRYPPEQQSLTQPNLASPILEGLEVPTLYGILSVPAGLDPNMGASKDMSDLLFDEARASFAVLAALDEEIPSVPALKQKKLGERALLHARYRAKLARKKTDDIDKLIAERKLTTAPLYFEPAKHDVGASRIPLPTVQDIHAGTLLIWSQAGNAPPPVWTFHEINYGQPLLRSGLREIVTLFLIGLLLVSLLPSGLRWLTAFWPEQLAFVFLTGVAIGGFTPLAAVGLLVALVARIFLCVRWTRDTILRWWNTPREEAVTPSSIHFQGPG